MVVVVPGPPSELTVALMVSFYPIPTLLMSFLHAAHSLSHEHYKASPSEALLPFWCMQ